MYFCALLYIKIQEFAKITKALRARSTAERDLGGGDEWTAVLALCITIGVGDAGDLATRQ